MRTLITGAAGFIGSTLVDRLLAEGHDVVGIDNLSTGRIANLAEAFCCNRNRRGRFTYLQNDIQAPELTDIVAGTNPDVIFHLAAIVSGEAEADFDKGYRINLDGTRYLFEAIRQEGLRQPYKPRVVFTSSID